MKFEEPIDSQQETKKEDKLVLGRHGAMTQEAADALSERTSRVELDDVYNFLIGSKLDGSSNDWYDQLDGNTITESLRKNPQDVEALRGALEIIKNKHAQARTNGDDSQKDFMFVMQNYLEKRIEEADQK